MLVYEQDSDTKNRLASEHSLGWVVKSVFNHKIVIVTAMVVGTAASIGAYVAITPLYEASTLLLVGQSGASDDWEAAKRTSELVASHARIAESEEVLKNAILEIGIDKLNIEVSPKTVGFGEKLRSLILRTKLNELATVAPIDTVVFEVAKSISVAPEARSNVIKISFKHPNPAIAAQFANALAKSFIDRQIELSDKPGTLDFLRIQKGRFDTEVERRSSNFEAFIKKQRAYSIVDQRTLLLKRASEIAAALTITRTTLAEKQGQKSALVSQLKLLKPVTLSPFVTSLVDTLGNDDRVGNMARSVPQLSDRTSGSGDPPLLMVRVYQDEMVALFKLNSDIKGLHDLADQQQKETNTINADLGSLIENQSEFEKLKREVGLATFNAELYAKRAVAEQIESDLRTAKLSNIKIIQPALVPMTVGFPNVRIFLGSGLILGSLIGIALAFLLETARGNAAASVPRSGTNDLVSDPLVPSKLGDQSPTSGRFRRAHCRNKRRRSYAGRLALSSTATNPPSQGTSQASSGERKVRGFKKFAVIGMACFILAAAATAAGVNDTRASGQLLEWARTNWMITVPGRG